MARSFRWPEPITVSRWDLPFNKDDDEGEGVMDSGHAQVERGINSFSRRAARMRASEIRELLKLLDRPGMVSFAGGIPDPMLFDLDVFRDAYAKALAENGAALQYSTSEGYPPLRRWISKYMSERGVTCTEDHVLITHGSQQALDLIGKLFLDSGNPVLTTAPTYLGALQSFSAFEPQFVPIRFGGEASITDVRLAKLIYLVPDFANPTGVTLSIQDRDAVLDLSCRTGAVVVEDAAYTSLRYEGSELPSILALDSRRSGSIDAGRTLYCGTFSKTVSPGLRVGWICGPADLIRRLTLVKQAADLHTSTINQQVVYQVADECFDALVSRARSAYAARRDAMLSALRDYAPEGVGWTEPSGGLFVWVSLPGLQSGRLLEKAIARNIAFVPGGAFFTDGRGANTLRLSFSLLKEETIVEGIRTLCDLMREELRQKAPDGRYAA